MQIAVDYSFLQVAAINIAQRRNQHLPEGAVSTRSAAAWEGWGMVLVWRSPARSTGAARAVVEWFRCAVPLPDRAPAGQLPVQQRPFKYVAQELNLASPKRASALRKRNPASRKQHST